MCKSHNPRVIDKCMRAAIRIIDYHFTHGECKPKLRILACCCGHGRYPMTIVFDNNHIISELFSVKVIPRKKKFYKKDKQGYYYIPEVSKEVKQ